MPVSPPLSPSDTRSLINEQKKSKALEPLKRLAGILRPNLFIVEVLDVEMDRSVDRAREPARASMFLISVAFDPRICQWRND